MSDDFNARYRLLKCVAVDDGLRTHNAQELATGRVVMVHLADAAGPEDVERLRAQLGRLAGSDKNRVLETATLPSGFAIVTEFLTGLTSFPAWLAQRGTGGAGGTEGARAPANPSDVSPTVPVLGHALTASEPPVTLVGTPALGAQITTPVTTPIMPLAAEPPAEEAASPVPVVSAPPLLSHPLRQHPPPRHLAPSPRCLVPQAFPHR